MHLGRRLPDQVELSRETYLQQSVAHASCVRDVVRSVLSVEKIKRRLTQLLAASNDLIDYDREVLMLQKSGVTKAELQRLEKVLREGNESVIPTGQLTRWKLSQALSHIAQDTAPRRRLDLEELAGGMTFNRK